MALVRLRHKPAQVAFNNLMDSFYANQPSILKAGVDKENTVSSRNSAPVNIKKTSAGYQVEVFAPGFQKDNFNIHLEEKTLTISTEMKNESKVENETYLQEEFKLKPFRRSFTLGRAIDTDNIDAKYVNGVLTLNLPQKKEVKASAKNISVE